jgi:hypothetical protein
MLTLVVGVGGMLLLSFIMAYLFGREYADGTAKNLLALPVARHYFVLAKLVVAAVWWFALVASVLAETLAIGLVLGLSGFSAGSVLSGSGNALLAAGIAYLLAPGDRLDHNAGPRLPAAARLRTRDARPRQRVRQDRLGGVVPLVDRPAVHRDDRAACPDDAREQLRPGGPHVPRRHRGNDPAAAVRRQHAIGAGARPKPSNRQGADAFP